MDNFKQKLHKIRCFMFDVDGVLTNNSLIVMPNELYRIMNIRDGYALKAAVEAGYHVAIISGGKSESVRVRLENLGVSEVHLGVQNKMLIYQSLLSKFQLTDEEVMYMGDDLPDYHVMKQAGIPVCPNDAVSEIMEMCLYVSPKKGGEGCVRDVIEQTMKLHSKWTITV